MPDPQKIAVYRVDNGQKQYIPEHWLDDPVLSRPFRKTPRQKAADDKKTPASGDTNEKGK